MVEIVEEREEQEAEHLGHLYFKTLCLLSDLHSLREFIVKAWSEYADCEIDLMTASIVTDSARKFGEELVEEVVADWQNSWAYPSEDLPRDHLQYCYPQPWNGWLCSLCHRIGLPYNEAMADVAE